jgi:ABC-2 type transport system permease protein
MNRALWNKAVFEARLLLALLVLVTFAFNVLYVWLTSLVELGALAMFLKTLPSAFERLAGVPFSAMATETGRLSVAYAHPVTVFVATAWCIARGSDCVSGEIGRGTMELLLAQPVRRTAIVAVHAAVTSVGAALIAAAAWSGMWLGIRLTRLAGVVDPARFVPSAINLFGFMFFLAAFSALVSACGRDRRRTIGLLAGFYLVQLLIKIVARAAKGFEWLDYGTFLSMFEPQLLAVNPDTAWSEVAATSAVLLGLGLTSYVAAAAVFARRDLPAPL